MTTGSQLDDALSRLAKREQTSGSRTVLYTIIPAVLAGVLVLNYNSRIDAKQQQVAKEVALREQTVSTVAIMVALKILDQQKFKKQLRALINGPVQAYARPGRFGGRLVVAKDIESARQIVAQYSNSETTAIRTAEIDQVVSSISELVNEADDLIPVHDQLGNLVLSLGLACRRAWEEDTKILPPNSTDEFIRILYDGAIRATQQLARTTTYADTAEFRDQFWSLHYGELPLIETTEVAIAMNQFAIALMQWVQGEQPAYLRLGKLAQDVADAIETPADEPD